MSGGSQTKWAHLYLLNLSDLLCLFLPPVACIHRGITMTTSVRAITVGGIVTDGITVGPQRIDDVVPPTTDGLRNSFSHALQDKRTLALRVLPL